MTNDRATPGDVLHAYRLLLGREPDQAGYDFHCALIKREMLTPFQLANLFIASNEFDTKHPSAAKVDEGKEPEEGVVTLASQACTYEQLCSPTFLYWAASLRERATRPTRKLWEWCFITQALYERGLLRENRRGLGFAVGTEPLSALFATRGCDIIASDLGPENASAAGWMRTSQHASSLKQLNNRGICPTDLFVSRVQFREVDMRSIPNDLGEFDFLWSSCALEHLGTLRNGIDFVINSMQRLRPGGVAVHTTELNCDSDDQTIEAGDNVLYRKRDLLDLAEQLRRRGYAVEPLDFTLGNTDADRYVDEVPYTGVAHLKLRIGKYASTSFGLIISRPAA